MINLLLTTLIWAFSFSLIGQYLAGHVDAYFSALFRVGIASLVFLPWILKNRIPRLLALRLMAIGGVQLGVMYIFYFQSFLLLTVPEVLVATIFTPLYVTILADLFRWKFRRTHLLTALLAIAGAGVIRYASLSEEFWKGFLVVQACNFCFALGQVAYRRVMEEQSVDYPQRHIFGYFHLGAFVVCLISWLSIGEFRFPQTSVQWGVLLWLGAIASGLGYFLWNKGATQVNAGTLAAMNNALIPAGLIVNILLWGQPTDVPRFLIGTTLLFLAILYSQPNKSPQILPKKQKSP